MYSSDYDVDDLIGLFGLWVLSGNEKQAHVGYWKSKDLEIADVSRSSRWKKRLEHSLSSVVEIVAINVYLFAH